MELEVDDSAPEEARDSKMAFSASASCLRRLATERAKLTAGMNLLRQAGQVRQAITVMATAATTAPIITMVMMNHHCCHTGNASHKLPPLVSRRNKIWSEVVLYVGWTSSCPAQTSPINSMEVKVPLMLPLVARIIVSRRSASAAGSSPPTSIISLPSDAR
jgi:hypothetical protein